MDISFRIILEGPKFLKDETHDHSDQESDDNRNKVIQADPFGKNVEKKEIDPKRDTAGK